MNVLDELRANLRVFVPTCFAICFSPGAFESRSLSPPIGLNLQQSVLSINARPSCTVLLENHNKREPEFLALHRVEHHLAHLSSAFHVSPFDQAAVASIDGFGDFSSRVSDNGHGASLNYPSTNWNSA
jgi:Carbamoyltransferase N-terminus